MTEDKSIKNWFGENLAELLGEKILRVNTGFNKSGFVQKVRAEYEPYSYTKRIELIADALKQYLPEEYREAITILIGILGEENRNETGMFKNYYWILPIGKFIEKYGVEYFEISVGAIEEVTKRNTGEYAIRPFARKYPEKTLAVCKNWAFSENFHLRRLASEGLRPKLPWAAKLDVWLNNPQPVFEILELLKEDDVKFVKKSVANHLRDWLKVNRTEAMKVINRWSESENVHTRWILKHAQRRLSQTRNPVA
ncbi:putative protein YhaZ [uncultured bacterium]|nr:putative protein YhaZ [uncultured bacterium]